MSPIVTQQAPHWSILISSSSGEGFEEIDAAGELVALTTQKSMAAPTGSFTLYLKMRPHPAFGDWYRLLKTNDYLEIYIGKTAQDLQDRKDRQEPIMRGLVDRVRTSIIQMGDNPQRTIMVTGSDVGKLWMISQVWYLAELTPAPLLVPPAQLQTFEGLLDGKQVFDSAKLIEPRDFLRRLVEIVHGMTGGLRTHNQAIPKFITQAVNHPRFKIMGISLQPYTGPVWNMLDYYANRPWAEAFIRDEVRNPVVYLRWTPFKDAAGQYAWLTNGMSGFSKVNFDSVGTVEIDAEDVVMRDVERSDSEAASLFYTQPTNLLLDRLGINFLSVISTRRAIQQLPTEPANPLMSVDHYNLYGYRQMQFHSPWLFHPDVAKTNETVEDLEDIHTTNILEVAQQLNFWLYQAFGHNPFLRSGHVTMRGNPAIRIGDYLVIKGGRVDDEEFYTESVQHELVPFSHYRTTCQVTRGRYLNEDMSQPTKYQAPADWLYQMAGFGTPGSGKPLLVLPQ